jgi:hypothetical protein
VGTVLFGARRAEPRVVTGTSGPSRADEWVHSRGTVTLVDGGRGPRVWHYYDAHPRGTRTWTRRSRAPARAGSRHGLVKFPPRPALKQNGQKRMKRIARCSSSGCNKGAWASSREFSRSDLGVLGVVGAPVR